MADTQYPLRVTPNLDGLLSSLIHEIRLATKCDDSIAAFVAGELAGKAIQAIRVNPNDPEFHALMVRAEESAENSR